MSVTSTPLTITNVKTGTGFASARVGMIFAPPEAQAGSMASLMHFFNETTNINATPGYYGPNKNPILRLDNLPATDAGFLTLLKRDFKQWQQRESGEISITTSPSLSCQAIDMPDHFPHQNAWKRFIKENTNTLTGLVYMAGSVGLLLAAWRSPARMPGKPKHDWLRAYTATSYFTASGLLVAMSQSQDNPRSIYKILEEIYPRFSHTNEEDQAYVLDTTNTVLSFLKKYPWETSMLLNATGASTHAISCARRGAKTELVGALATMTGCMLSSVIPEKGGRSLLPIGEWLEDEHGHTLYDRIEHFSNEHPNLGGWMKNVNRAYDWLEENPLKASVVPFAAANATYAVAGIRHRNPGLVAMSGSFLAGNYTQSQATKGRGDSFDSVVTAAANIIKSDPMLDTTDKKQIGKHIHQLVHRLQHEQEIVHSESRMEKGVLARLERENSPDDPLAGFLPSERQALANSPFVEQSHLARVVLSEEETSGMTM